MMRNPKAQSASHRHRGQDACLPGGIGGLSPSGEPWGSLLGVVVRCRRDPASAMGGSALSSHVRGLTTRPRLLVSWPSPEGLGLGTSTSPMERLPSIP